MLASATLRLANGGAPSKLLGEDMIWGTGVYLADTEEEPIRKVEPSHDERYKWFARGAAALVRAR